MNIHLKLRLDGRVKKGNRKALIDIERRYNCLSFENFIALKILQFILHFISALRTIYG